MTTPLRLLFSSNCFWCASGYGVQANSLLPRLAELPEYGGRQAIAQHAWYGLEGGIHEWKGFRIYPRFNDPYGNDVIGAHTKHFGANIVVSLIDIWVLHETARKIAPALFCPWLPIDHDPVPAPFLRSLEGAHLPLTYSKWGHDMLTKAGVANEYIPHGIEPDVFKVDPNRDEVLAFKREVMRRDHGFLCIMVAANKGFPDRKWFQGQLEAFRDFRDGNPDIMLYIHTLRGQAHGGVNFDELIARLGLQGALIFPDEYMYQLGYPPEFLALMYNAADCFMGASMSEGFGIPIIEAGACGCPVIVTDFSAMPELVRWGHKVEVEDMVLTGMMSYQAWPSKRDMTDKLRRLYEAWTICGGDWPMSQRLTCSQAIHAEYDWNTIVRDQWAPLMARLAEEAPPLDTRFTSLGIGDVPIPSTDEVGSFVEAINEELQKEKPRVPRHRVEPLTSRHPIRDEEQADIMNNGIYTEKQRVASNEEWQDGYGEHPL